MEEEFKKIHKIEKWARDSTQICSQIIQAYLDLEADYKIPFNVLEKWCAQNVVAKDDSILGSQKFLEHFASMKTDAGKAHGKIFYKEGLFVKIWDKPRAKIEKYFLSSKIIFPDEIENSDEITEGAKRTVTVNFYERDPKARQKCIDHFGSLCSVCDFNFEEMYGEIGQDFIHVHHLTPLSLRKEEYEVNPIEDLIPVCPNCHAMLHKRNPPYTVEELKSFIEGEK